MLAPWPQNVEAGGRWRIRTSDFLLVRQALWASELTARVTYWILSSNVSGYDLMSCCDA